MHAKNTFIQIHKHLSTKSVSCKLKYIAVDKSNNKKKIWTYLPDFKKVPFGAKLAELTPS